MKNGSPPLSAQAPTPEQWLESNAQASSAERAAVQLLAAMEGRALADVERTLAAGFTMVFPGPAEYQSLEAMVRGAAGRYQRVAKRIEAVESFTVGAAAPATAQTSATDVVYVRGTLYGVNSHGVEFADVRFIDRFELAGDSFLRQDVWNDLAESGVLSRGA